MSNVPSKSPRHKNRLDKYVQKLKQQGNNDVKGSSHRSEAAPDTLADRSRDGKVDLARQIIKDGSQSAVAEEPTTACHTKAEVEHRLKLADCVSGGDDRTLEAEKLDLAELCGNSNDISPSNRDNTTSNATENTVECFVTVESPRTKYTGWTVNGIPQGKGSQLWKFKDGNCITHMYIHT